MRIEAATHNLARARMEIRDLERTLKADIRDRFAQVLFLRDKETLAKEFVQLQEELSRLVSVKYEAGDVAALEVNLSQVELATGEEGPDCRFDGLQKRAPFPQDAHRHGG